MPMNALQLCRWQFSHKKKLFSRISLNEVRFYTENGRFALLSPLWGLEATIDVHLRFIGKRLPVSVKLIELFLLDATAKALRRISTEIRDDCAPTGAGWSKFLGISGRPHQLFFSENWAKWSFVRYKNLDTSFFRFVAYHAFHRRTDSRTDRQTDGQTVFSSLDRVCIPRSAVETHPILNAMSKNKRKGW